MRIQSLVMHVLKSHVVHTFEVTGVFFFFFKNRGVWALQFQ